MTTLLICLAGGFGLLTLVWLARIKYVDHP